MLSYQHHYHVGNHADVLKHWILYECITYMQKKPKALDYIDTHSGAGLYQLNDSKTQKLKEFESGVNVLLDRPIDELNEFISLLKGFTSAGEYPGSPTIVGSLLRDMDKSWLYELHPQTFAELQQHFATKKSQRKKQTFVRQEDGFIGLQALLPTASKRALVLIDPSYELKQDYSNVVNTIQKAIQKMAQSMILLWYPVVHRSDVDFIEQQLLNSDVRNVLQLELSITADSDEKGMTGSGMIIVNPPWTLTTTAETVLPKLAHILSGGTGTYRNIQLIAE